MTNHIRITTETHHDLSQHIVYATIRPTLRTWHTIELDRHTIGKYNHDTHQEAKDLTAATIKHYCQTEPHWHAHAEASAEPTPTTRALLALKMQETDDATRRGQTIINQIKREREARKAAMTQRRAQMPNRRPTGWLDLITNKEHSVFA